mgnify:FL=1|jgi:hypothetical protein|tara:strand:+ start:589 stop:780 length:192 start_codon:yes stop_codon:yes gene_type:complete
MWTYLKKGDKVIGKHNLSEERLKNYIEMGYEVCEEDGCKCIDEVDTKCKPKPKAKSKSKKKDK